MPRTTELTPLLKSLKLGALSATLPERIALARRDHLDYASFLEIILSDEVNRRAHRRIELRLNNAGFEETCRLEDFDWSASITLDRRLLDAVFSLEFLDKHDHVLLVGPAGVGKSFLAQALGYAAVRAGHTVRFSHADGFFKAMLKPGSTTRWIAPSGPSCPQTCSSWTTWGCTASPLSSRPICMNSSSTAIGRQVSSSPVTGPSTNGSVSLTTPSSATAPSIGWPTPATRSSSKVPAIASDSRHTAPFWAPTEVIDRQTVS